MSLAADLTRVCISGLHVRARVEMSRMPSSRPVSGSMIGAPVHAKTCRFSVKCSGPTTRDRPARLQDRADPVGAHRALGVGEPGSEVDPVQQAADLARGVEPLDDPGPVVGQGDDQRQVGGVGPELVQHGPGAADQTGAGVDLLALVGQGPVRVDAGLPAADPRGGDDVGHVVGGLAPGLEEVGASGRDPQEPGLALRHAASSIRRATTPACHGLSAAAPPPRQRGVPPWDSRADGHAPSVDGAALFRGQRGPRSCPTDGDKP